MKTILAAPIVLAGAIAFGSSAAAQEQQELQGQQHQQHPQQQQPPQGAEQFLTQAVQGDLAEIALGKLAQERGQSEQVRQYGEKLVEDHSRALEEAQQLARSRGVAVPDEPAPEAQQMHRQLMQLSGEEFDREFVRHMVQDHEKAIDLFETQAEEGDSDVSELAEQTLPVLEEHLQIAESIQPGGRG